MCNVCVFRQKIRCYAILKWGTNFYEKAVFSCGTMAAWWYLLEKLSIELIYNICMQLYCRQLYALWSNKMMVAIAKRKNNENNNCVQIDYQHQIQNPQHSQQQNAPSLSQRMIRENNFIVIVPGCVVTLEILGLTIWTWLWIDSGNSNQANQYKTKQNNTKTKP